MGIKVYNRHWGSVLSSNSLSGVKNNRHYCIVYRQSTDLLKMTYTNIYLFYVFFLIHMHIYSKSWKSKRIENSTIIIVEHFNTSINIMINFKLILANYIHLCIKFIEHHDKVGLFLVCKMVFHSKVNYN